MEREFTEKQKPINPDRKTGREKGGIMEMTLDQIQMKLGDYKVCRKCHRINWYENEECIECGGREFDESKVEQAIRDEIDFYLNEEGYDFEETMNIYTDV